MIFSPDLSTTDTEDGMVLLNERTGRYWTLNATGATVVRLLIAGETAEDAISRLSERYPSARARIADDVAALLRSLRDAEVVVP